MPSPTTTAHSIRSTQLTMKSLLQTLTACCLTLALFFSSTLPAWAFCGFYVGGANAQLFNKASQVIIAHQGERTILTMANDFQGDVKDFALVVPVPVAITKAQVNIGDPAIVKKLDEFSQPRLVEYNDSDPCPPPVRNETSDDSRAALIDPPPMVSAPASVLGVKIEDQFQVGEYEILILSANDSNGLETWLQQNKYQVPKGASEVLKPYIRQNMKFFVAKVNLQELANSGSQLLRPLQIAYKSPKFMLPIRLGMLNAQGEQDLVAYLLSPKGRIELVNYRTIDIPTNKEIPEFVQSEFGKFYQATFQKSHELANKKVAFLEYAWDVSNCDPCTTTAPDRDELKKAGVFWQEEGSSNPTYITRLHVRYDRAHFAEDLVFQETSNTESFQGRYILNHPYRKRITCGATKAKEYERSVTARQQTEAQNLALLTGWKIDEIKAKISPVEIYTSDRDEPFWPW
jgi:hypothetical protein